jgi:hypothetical protein
VSIVSTTHRCARRRNSPTLVCLLIPATAARSNPQLNSVRECCARPAFLRSPGRGDSFDKLAREAKSKSLRAMPLSAPKPLRLTCEHRETALGPSRCFAPACIAGRFSDTHGVEIELALVVLWHFARHRLNRRHLKIAKLKSQTVSSLSPEPMTLPRCRNTQKFTKARFTVPIIQEYGAPVGCDA